MAGRGSELESQPAVAVAEGVILLEVVALCAGCTYKGQCVDDEALLAPRGRGGCEVAAGFVCFTARLPERNEVG